LSHAHREDLARRDGVVTLAAMIDRAANLLRPVLDAANNST
jgi:hypothetical protein